MNGLVRLRTPFAEDIHGYSPAGRSVLEQIVPEVLSTKYLGHNFFQYGPT